MKGVGKTPDAKPPAFIEAGAVRQGRLGPVAYSSSFFGATYTLSSPSFRFAP